MAAKSAQQQQAANDYLRDKVDRVVFYVPKGRKEAIQAAASAQGESLNKFVCQAVDERIERLQAAGKKRKPTPPE